MDDGAKADVARNLMARAVRWYLFVVLWMRFGVFVVLVNGMAGRFVLALLAFLLFAVVSVAGTWRELMLCESWCHLTGKGRGDFDIVRESQFWALWRDIIEGCRW